MSVFVPAALFSAEEEGVFIVYQSLGRMGAAIFCLKRQNSFQFRTRREVQAVTHPVAMSGRWDVVLNFFSSDIF
jgi:hypothetical protein